MAAKRNYQPTLRRFLQLLSKYISRYRTLLDAGMTTDQALALTVFIGAMESLIGELGADPINP